MMQVVTCCILIYYRICTTQMLVFLCAIWTLTIHRHISDNSYKHKWACNWIYKLLWHWFASVVRWWICLSDFWTLFNEALGACISSSIPLIFCDWLGLWSKGMNMDELLSNLQQGKYCLVLMFFLTYLWFCAIEFDWHLINLQLDYLSYPTTLCTKLKEKQHRFLLQSAIVAQTEFTEIV